MNKIVKNTKYEKQEWGYDYVTEVEIYVKRSILLGRKQNINIGGIIK